MKLFSISSWKHNVARIVRWSDLIEVEKEKNMILTSCITTFGAGTLEVKEGRAAVDCFFTAETSVENILGEYSSYSSRHVMMYEGGILPEYVTVKGLTNTQTYNLMPLQAPWFEAFWSDYNLFRDPLKAYEYAKEYVEHYNSEGQDANSPDTFEMYSVPGTGFDLTWTTRSGNYLYYKYCPGYETEKEWTEDDNAICFQTSCSIMYDLVKLLDNLNFNQEVKVSWEKTVSWE